MYTDSTTSEHRAQFQALGRALVENYLELVDDSAVAILPHALRVFVELGLPEALAAIRPSATSALPAVHGTADLPVTDLPVADLPVAGVPLAELALVAQVPPDLLRRLLAALAGVDVVSASGSDVFRLTDLGRRLLPSGDARVSALNRDSWRAWMHAADALRGGVPAFAAGHERQEFFDHKDAVPGANREFLNRMRERARRCYAQMPSVVDWSGARVVMDVGGGDGFLLGEILGPQPHLRGRLLDRAATLEAIDVAGLRRHWGARWESVPGDFFDRLPGGADVHMLASVLHDWDDDRVVAILRHSREALPPGGRLLVVEMLLPEDGREHPARWSDLGMMVLTGGQERTGAQYRKLLRSAGYELDSVRAVPDSFFSVLSAF